MKSTIHPNYNSQTPVTCSCGNSFTVGSTAKSMHVELCSKCHPFYTGQQKFVDTASRIEKFQKKMERKDDTYKKKATEIKEDDRPKTLREMLQSIKR
jgi:large subunit ribosomal protein L31